MSHKNVSFLACPQASEVNVRCYFPYKHYIIKALHGICVEKFCLADELCHAGLTWMFHLVLSGTSVGKKSLGDPASEEIAQGKYDAIQWRKYAKCYAWLSEVEGWKWPDSSSAEKCHSNTVAITMVNVQMCYSVALGWCRIGQFSWEEHELGAYTWLKPAFTPEWCLEWSGDLVAWQCSVEAQSSTCASVAHSDHCEKEALLYI